MHRGFDKFQRQAYFVIIFQGITRQRRPAFFVRILGILQGFYRRWGKSILAFGGNMLNHALPDIFMRCLSRRF
jgi:hypothetical protein